MIQNKKMRALLLLYFLLACIFLGYASKKDSLQKRYEYYFERAKQYRESDNEKQMLLSGQKAIDIAQGLSDKVAKAKVYIAFGNYYYSKDESSVSSYEYYYKAYREYRLVKDSVKMSKTLLRLAILEKNTRNFLKSKESSFLALELLKGEQSDFLESIYNNLGIVYGELKDLKSAVFYHQKALLLRERENKQELVIQSYNNIACAFMDNGYLSSAKRYFLKGLSYDQNLLLLYPIEYSRLLDNYAHLKSLLSEKGALDDLQKALFIRQKINHQAGILTSYLHLSDYYQKKDNIALSNSYANKAYLGALKGKKYRDVLSSLVILESNSQRSGDYKKALQYAKKYNQVMDYLSDAELKINEKFADLRYLATQKQKENKDLRLLNKEQQLTTERRKKYLYIVIGLLGVVTLAGIGYFQYSKMEYKQKEQKASQEIIELLYQKQEVAQIAKHLEQQRIANDLHDSVAGKLSGLMLKLDTIGVISPQEIKNKIDPAVDHLQDILQELKCIVHDMNEQQVVCVSYPLLIEGIANQQFSGKTRITSFIDSLINWESISSQVKLEFYYIIQQAIRNINEHSKASMGFVEIRQVKNNLLLTISDNGQGFNGGQKSGMGISGMRKRVKEVGGDFQIESSKDNGTIISIKITLS